MAWHLTSGLRCPSGTPRAAERRAPRSPIMAFRIDDCPAWCLSQTRGEQGLADDVDVLTTPRRSTCLDSAPGCRIISRASNVSTTCAASARPGVLTIHLDSYPEDGRMLAQIVADAVENSEGRYLSVYGSDRISRDRLTVDVGVRFGRSTSSLLKARRGANALVPGGAH